MPHAVQAMRVSPNHAVHTIIVIGSDQQHALSLTTPPQHLEYFHRGFVAKSIHQLDICTDTAGVTTILLLLSLQLRGLGFSREYSQTSLFDKA